MYLVFVSRSVLLLCMIVCLSLYRTRLVNGLMIFHRIPSIGERFGLCGSVEGSLLCPCLS